MFTPDDELIRYDGRTLAVTTRPMVQVEARRGRRWGWFGQKGWWVHLYLFRGWHSKKFVFTLSEVGIFLKHDPEYLSWIDEGQKRPAVSDPGREPPFDSSAWSSGAPFLMF